MTLKNLRATATELGPIKTIRAKAAGNSSHFFSYRDTEFGMNSEVTSPLILVLGVKPSSMNDAQYMSRSLD